MKPQNETIRDSVIDALISAGIEVRTLTIDAVDGHLAIRGTLPTIEQQELLIDLLRVRLEGVTSIEYDVGLRKVGPTGHMNGLAGLDLHNPADPMDESRRH